MVVHPGYVLCSFGVGPLRRGLTTITFEAVVNRLLLSSLTCSGSKVLSIPGSMVLFDECGEAWLVLVH